MEKLIRILQESHPDAYRICETTTISHQAYFIKQKLDQHRISKTRHTTVTVYMDEGNMRGLASKEIYNDLEEDEIRQEIEDLKFNASLAQNPYFELPKNNKHYEECKEMDILSSYRNVIEAIQSVKDTETESINSYEIFVEQEYVHIVNSEGVDVSYNNASDFVEIVINSTKDNHEVEICKMMKCGADQKPEEIRRFVENIFHSAKDKNNAVPLQKMHHAHVLISGEDLKEFFRYFISKSSTSSIYSQTSQVKVGDVIQTGDDCDKVTLKAVAQIPFSSSNIPYSSDGVEIKDFTVVENGVYKTLNGDSRTAYYLKVEGVCPINNFVVSPGSKSIEEMKKEPYLEACAFSNFQMNPMTGDFGGEIRLGYYYDGEKTVPVTSGSITCNMDRVVNHIYFSKEMQQVDNCILPLYIELFDITVAGE